VLITFLWFALLKSFRSSCPLVCPSFLACIIAFVPYKTFAKLQDEFFAVSKQMRNEKDPEEKMKLLKELQEILKESHRVLEEIHKKSNQK
jgi:hypothetical protein